MNLFESILSEMHLLLEDADITSVNNAIRGLHPATIRYDDGESDAKTGERKIFPVAYGISTAGNPVVRAYQENGDSKRGIPNWKFFKLANITSWNTNEEETFDPEKLVGFNKNGDEQMQTLYNIAPIGIGKQYTKQEGEKTTAAIKPGPIEKKDIPGSDEYKDNEKYTANNAVNDILRGVSEKNVDKKPETSYNDKDGDRVNAPEETKPVLKSDLETQETLNAVKTEKPNQNSTEPTNEPIMKSNIETKKEPEITKSYNDMMQRMNNLNKDEQEDKEEI